MKRNSDPQKLRSYITELKLQDYMNSDIFCMSELCFFEKGEHLIRAGAVSDYLYFLAEGKLMVYSFASNAKNICISYIQQSALIGEAASLWEIVPNASVKAMTPCVCVGINLLLYRSTLQNDIRFLKNVCQTLSARLNSETHLASSLSESIDIRLAEFILSHSGNGIFSFQLTVCAAILNVSYRHLLRTLSGLCDGGILKKSHKGYVILNRGALEGLAHDAPDLQKISEKFPQSGKSGR